MFVVVFIWGLCLPGGWVGRGLQGIYFGAFELKTVYNTTKTTWLTCKRWICASARTGSPPLGLGAALCAVKAAQGILPLQAPCVLYGKPEIRVA